MEPTPPPAGGILGACRALGDSLLASVEARVELFGVELQEEKHRLIQAMIWIGAAICTGLLALTFASLALVYVCWDHARLAVLVGLALVYGGALAAIIVTYRRRRARQPKPFAGTLAELREDRACIQPER